MGVEYYLTVKDRKRKRVLVVWLGRHFSSDASQDDIKLIDSAVERIQDLLSDDILSEIEDVEITKLKVGHILNLLSIVKEAEKIKYNTNIHDTTDLYQILKVYGLVSGLIDFWEQDNYEWEIVSEYQLFEDEKFDGRLKEFKDEGYEVILWEG